MIDSSTIASAIEQQIAGSVERSVQEYVENIVRALAMDQAWINKMEKQINEAITRRIAQKLSLVDVSTVVADAVGPVVEKYFSLQPPTKTGISDQAQSTELVIEDGCVTVEHDLASASLKVTADAEIGKTLLVRDLVVRNSINIDNASWKTLGEGVAQRVKDALTNEWKQSLIDSVANAIKKDGIDFDDVKIDGHALVDGETLSSGVRRSSLCQVGTLENLRVAGAVDLHDSLSVRARRVGINTEHPDMALSVWDEEVALIFGKHREQTAFIGTLRPQRLTIGVNRQPAIDIDEQGQITVKNLMVGRHRICHEPECPNYSGTKGDIVFNSNPKNDGVWGWQCLGAFRWQPLRSS